ncbi:MAG: mechanosensitive ion channel [Armatimonadetes bacterium]|nr:mechanosensitive ion channel [Armatimonadota bacterium]
MPHLAVFDDLAEWLNRPFFHLGEWDLTAFVMIRLVLYPVLAILLAKWIRRGVRRGLKRHPHIDEATHRAIATVVYYVSLIIGVLVALNAAGMPIQNLAVFSGAIGLGIGLGLQQIAQNFLSGILLLTGRSVRTGDWLTYDGHEGSVEDIGFYSTLIRTPDDGEMIVPNSQLLNGKVINWTRKRALRRITVAMPLSHKHETEQCQRVLLEAVAGCPGVLNDPKPSVAIKGVRAAGADWDVSVWTSEHVSSPGVLSSRLVARCLEACRENGIELAAT